MMMPSPRSFTSCIGGAWFWSYGCWNREGWNKYQRKNPLPCNSWYEAWGWHRTDPGTRTTQKRADCRIVMLTGFGNIATAVAAVKAGALTISQNQQIRSLLHYAIGWWNAATTSRSNGADRVRCEHIQRVYEQCGRNVSETARRLRCTDGPCNVALQTRSARLIVFNHGLDQYVLQF